MEGTFCNIYKYNLSKRNSKFVKFMWNTNMRYTYIKFIFLIIRNIKNINFKIKFSILEIKIKIGIFI